MRSILLLASACVLLLTGAVHARCCDPCCDPCCCDPCCAMEASYETSSYEAEGYTGVMLQEAAPPIPQRSFDGSQPAALTSLDSFAVAYLPGQLNADFEAQFMRMAELAGQQGLLSAHTHVWGIAPDVIAREGAPDAQHWAAVTVSSGQGPSGELLSYTVPGGAYLLVHHIGAYDGLHNTWIKFFEWAMANGIELDAARPALTHFVSDPGSTAADKLVSELYLPIK
jgi:DNA gyrase inhibitor GyrI